MEEQTRPLVSSVLNHNYLQGMNPPPPEITPTLEKFFPLLSFMTQRADKGQLVPRDFHQSAAVQGAKEQKTSPAQKGAPPPQLIERKPLQKNSKQKLRHLSASDQLILSEPEAAG